MSSNRSSLSLSPFADLSFDELPDAAPLPSSKSMTDEVKSQPDEILLEGLKLGSIEDLLAAFIKKYLLPKAELQKDRRSIRNYTKIREKLESSRGGLCLGITGVVLYSLWLEKQPRRMSEEKEEPVARDDWSWLQAVLTVLELSAGGAYTLNEREQAAAERLLSLVRFYQKQDSLLLIGEGDYHKSFEDSRQRQLQQEYTLVSFLTPNDFVKDLTLPVKKEEKENPPTKTTLLDLIAKEGKLVFIGTEDHVLGLIRLGKTLYCVNTRFPTLVVPYQASQQEDLLTQIFKDNNFFPKIYPTIGAFDVRVFGFDAQAKGPDQAMLLSQLDVFQSPPHQKSLLAKISLDEHCPTLDLAVRAGCVPSLQFYLQFLKTKFGRKKYKSLVDHAEAHSHYTALDYAAYNGREEAYKALVKAGADIAVQTSKGQTTYGVARSESMQQMVIEVLAQRVEEVKADKPSFAKAQQFFPKGKHAREEGPQEKMPQDKNQASPQKTPKRQRTS